MPIQMLMPALSPTMTEGNLAKWLKKEGDAVAPGDLIAEVETDKATMEIEAIEEGVLGKILVAEGTEGIPVNTPIAVILEEGEDASALDGFVAAAPAAPAQPEVPAAEPAPTPQAPPRRPPRPRRQRRRTGRAGASSPARWRGAWRNRPVSNSQA